MSALWDLGVISVVFIIMLLPAFLNIKLADRAEKEEVPDLR